MFKRNGYEQDLINDIHNLKAKINRRLKNIEKRFGVNADPISSYKKLGLSDTLKGMNEAQLLHEKRLLRQFNEKQFTRVRGYQKYKEWKSTYDFIAPTEKENKMIWELYNRYVEENKIAEHYKYETLQVISEEIESGSTPLEIHNKLNDLYSKELGFDQNEPTSIPFSKKFKRRYKK